MTIAKASVKKRAAMSKQSPYAKSVAKAGKTVPKKPCTAKEVASAAKLVQGKRTPTKKERLDAKARARAWAKRELGQKKKSSQPAAFGQTVIAKDAEDVADPTNREMVNALDQVGKSDNQYIAGDISEDVFYDAMEFLEEEENQEDIVVEDASDDDEEIFSLRSASRNRRPTHGQSWMEPVVMGLKKPDPDDEMESTCV